MRMSLWRGINSKERSVTKNREEWTVFGANPVLVLAHRLLDIRSLSLLTWGTLILLGQGESIFWINMT